MPPSQGKDLRGGGGTNAFWNFMNQATLSRWAGRAMRSQVEPRRARGNQGELGVVRRSQGEPGRTRGSQGEPRRTQEVLAPPRSSWVPSKGIQGPPPDKSYS